MRQPSATLIAMWRAILLAGILVIHLAHAAGRPPDKIAQTPSLWATEQLHQGTVIDFDSYCRSVPVAGADPDECRTLTGEQFAALLQTALPAKSAAHAIEIRGLHVMGDVDLRGSELGYPLTVLDSRIDGTLQLGDSHFLKSLTLQGMHISGDIAGPNLRVAGSFTVANSDVGGVMNLHSAHTDGDAMMTGSTFARDVNFDSAQITGSLFLDNAHIAGRVLLSSESVDRNSGAKVEQTVFFNHTTITGPIFGNEVRIGQDINFTAASCSEVWLIAANIAGFLKLNDGNFASTLQAGNMRIGQSLVASGAKFHGDVYIDAVTTLANIRLDGATFDKQVSATQVDVKGELTATKSTFNGPVYLGGSRIGWRLQFADATFAKNVDATDLDVHGRLDLSGAALAENLYLSQE